VWLKHRVEQYRTLTNVCEDIDNFDELNKLGQGFTSPDPLEKVDIRNGSAPRLMFVNQKLEVDYKVKLIKLLN
jgi:hypothetical protein